MCLQIQLWMECCKDLHLKNKANQQLLTYSCSLKTSFLEWKWLIMRIYDIVHVHLYVLNNFTCPSVVHVFDLMCHILLNLQETVPLGVYERNMQVRQMSGSIHISLCGYHCHYQTLHWRSSKWCVFGVSFSTQQTFVVKNKTPQKAE